MDFLRNRTFRQTLLCHEGIRLSPRLRVEDLSGFYVASLAGPVAERPDLHSLSPEQFRTPGGPVISVSQPISKAAMLDLSEKSGRADASVAELGQWRHGSGGRASSQGATEAKSSRSWCNLSVSAYTGAAPGDCRLANVAPRYASNVSERPIASPLALYQAESANRVTNLRHEPNDASRTSAGCCC